jgi:UDPglucose 6-dehydrogenase
MNILIIGFGVVGRNMRKIFTDADIWDPPFYETAGNMLEAICTKGSMDKQYDVAFVCVPTPKLKNGKCDTSVVSSVIAEHAGHVNVFCIKSTVPPGTTEHYYHATGYKKFVFSPEYFGSTQHANAPDYNFVILGGTKDACAVVARAYEEVSSADLRIYQTDSTTAELVKYMENSWLAMKVSFCNEFARIAKTFDVDYRELRELWLADPRVNRSHTFVYEDRPFYDSHCLSKDIPAIIMAAEESGYTPRLLREMEIYNRVQKEFMKCQDEATK